MSEESRSLFKEGRFVVIVKPSGCVWIGDRATSWGHALIDDGDVPHLIRALMRARVYAVGKTQAWVLLDKIAREVCPPDRDVAASFDGRAEARDGERR